MAMLIQSDYNCTAANVLIVTLRNMLCFVSLLRLCKYNDTCYDVKYAFISFYTYYVYVNIMIHAMMLNTLL